MHRSHVLYSNFTTLKHHRKDKIFTFRFTVKKKINRHLRAGLPVLCNAKIITKALAIRMSNVMNEIIVNTQMAYVRGRSVIDNLRSIAFMNDHCRNENVDSVMVSLDAKKAFDSVDHGYIVKTLERYGFGPKLKSFLKPCIRMLQ